MKALSFFAALAVFAATPAALALPGDYKEIQCSTQAFFAANGCNQCFDGGKVTVGQKLTGFYDTWTNKNETDQVAYKDEQAYPSMVNLGGPGTSWKIVPNDPGLYWKYGNEVVWVESLSGSGKMEFTLEPGKTVTFMEADLGANYSLEKTDKKEGQFVGLMKFPVAYHDISESGVESAKQNHVECVAFASNQAVPAATVPAPKAPAPEVTKVKTGPETFLLFAVASLLAFVFVAFRRKNA